MHPQTIWTRSGNEISYPGIVQSKSTCVLVSLAGAINYIAKTALTEQSMIDAHANLGSPPINFDTAQRCVVQYTAHYKIRIDRFHDKDSPLNSIDFVFNKLRNGAVLIPSFQIGELQGTDVVRIPNWHMLSIFNLSNGMAQVWDTNDNSGFTTESEISDYLLGNYCPIPYPPPKFLLSHDQHEAILVYPEECV